MLSGFNVSREAEEKQDQQLAEGTLAAPPEWPTILWKDTLPRYQALFSNYQSAFKHVATTPETASRRYQQRSRTRKPNPLQIPPGQQVLLTALSLPDRWRRYIHPEGNILFYCPELHIFTESNICDREIEGKLLCCATDLLQRAIDTPSVTLDEHTVLVLNVNDGNWCYYFVDHTNRLLFWVDPIMEGVLGTHLQGVSDYSRIRYLIESHYWYAVSCNSLVSVFEDLKGMFTRAKADMLTADSSASPFARDQLMSIAELVNSLPDDEKINNPHNTWVVARLMTYFTESQFSNFYGQPCARLNADTPWFESQNWNRRGLFKLANILLLGSLNEHARRLDRVCVDSRISMPRWKEFVDGFMEQLGQCTIFSTVMLAVDFSFLAVPGVTNPDVGATAVEITIYCSIVATTASILFSLASVNMHSTPGVKGALPVTEILQTLSRLRSGMAYLAIMHSLPIAGVMWSMILFTTALGVQFFGPKQRATVATLGVECGIIFILAVICHFVTRRFYNHSRVDHAKEVALPPAASVGDASDV